MSRVIDGHNTPLDYVLRSMGYEQVANFIQGNLDARRDSGWVDATRRGIAFSLGDLDAGPRVHHGGHGDFDFFDDFMTLSLSDGTRQNITDPSLIEDLRAYDEALQKAKVGEVFGSTDKTVLFFRKMAENAREKADRIAYVQVCGGRSHPLSYELLSLL